MNQFHLLITYWVCAGVGFIYIVGSAALGHLHGSEEMEVDGDADFDGDGGNGGDPGDVDGGDPGDVDGGDPGGDSGDVDGDNDPGDVDSNSQHQHGGRPTAYEQAAAGTMQRNRLARSESLFFKILGIFSPTKLAMYLFFFGAVGVCTLAIFPFLGFISLLPAIIFGYGIGRILLNALSRLFSSFNSSTNFKQESLIGAQADLILSIEPGTLGEITVSTRGSRHTAAARAKDPDMAIKNLSKVIICDRQDGVFIVEPVQEEI